MRVAHGASWGLAGEPPATAHAEGTETHTARVMATVRHSKADRIGKDMRLL
jgi:hypothetical protein